MVDLNRLVPRMQPYATTIFGQMSARASELGAVNLGQGFPDVDGPDALKDMAIAAIADGSGNQYPPAHGSPVLRRAIAEHQRLHYGLIVSPDDDVVVTTGASEALAASVIALASTGDEVVVLEPYFDLYAAIIAMAGANRVTVPLLAPTDNNSNFRLDVAALQAVIGPRTKAIILNSPHNPTGMVLTKSELEAVANVARENDIVIVSDEAYEHLVFDGVEHIPIATLPGMFERTITIGSGGKSFSFTGWKVGWASGPSDLIAAVRVVRQHLSYVSGGPFQGAIAAGLAFPESFFTGFAADLAARRDLLSAGLQDLGYGVLPTAGTYFITSDIRPLGATDGRAHCDFLLNEVGVAAIPIQALCDDEEQFAPYVRWTFCKRPEVLAQALERLGG